MLHYPEVPIQNIPGRPWETPERLYQYLLDNKPAREDLLQHVSDAMILNSSPLILVTHPLMLFPIGMQRHHGDDYLCNILRQGLEICQENYMY